MTPGDNLLQTGSGVSAIETACPLPVIQHYQLTIRNVGKDYRGANKRVRRDGLQWHIAARPSDIAKMRDGRAKVRVQKQEHHKASVRAKVEPPFRVIKRQFGLVKVRFKGLAKNTAHVITLFALSNLWMARHQLIKKWWAWCARKQPEGCEQGANRVEETVFRVSRSASRATCRLNR